MLSIQLRPLCCPCRSPAHSVAVEGVFKNYNTIEEFKAADKPALFAQVADEVCRSQLFIPNPLRIRASFLAHSAIHTCLYCSAMWRGCYRVMHSRSNPLHRSCRRAVPLQVHLFRMIPYCYLFPMSRLPIRAVLHGLLLAARLLLDPPLGCMLQKSVVWSMQTVLVHCMRPGTLPSASSARSECICQLQIYLAPLLTLVCR